MYEYRKLSKSEREELVQQRLAQGYPPHSPPHPIRDQEFYLLTTTCYEHKKHLHTSKRRQEILYLHFEQFIGRGMELRAWVVLPNHYHFLARVTQFSEIGPIFRKVHGSTARGWNLEDDSLGRQVWYRYTDRAIRSERHYYTTINYIHYNPVKHGYVNSPYEWVESSVHWYREHQGVEWFRDLWVEYPLKNYGKGWDDN